MSTGKINVQADNIFPIIKKFLYSDHEIFLRELVSNAVDATKKLKTLTSIGKAKVELGNTKINIKVNKDAKTITISDRGIGMTSEEVKKYINQIAFSGAEEFVKKYKNETEGNPLIGHFGLGFYSAFMVADRVEIFTKSYKEKSKAVRWECDGSPEYTLEPTEKKDRGTDIILHIAEDAEEFLEKERIQTILKKYCKFLPEEISFENEVINNTQPAWTKKPTDLKDEDYKNFYKELYPFAPDPLFWIHLNVDYPFNLTGILYFPKITQNFEVQKDKIQLYCNQVFVTDSLEGIVPEFLTLLRGVIDSPDIPLNVSRSYLQSDARVKKISNHISKKVADKLEEIFKNDRKSFEEKWNDIKVLIQYGMMSEEKFYERANKFCLLKNVDGKYFTLEEYQKHIKDKQEDKNKKLVYLYASNPDEQHSYIKAAKDKGYDVLLMDGFADNHFVNLLEQKLENAVFTRVDADTIDKLIDKDEKYESVLTEKQQNELKPLIEKQLDKQSFNVVFESLSPNDQPMLITRPEFMRRMKDMSQLSGGMGIDSLPDQLNLVVNANHPLISKIADESDNKKKEALVKQTKDLALLSQNMLKGEELTQFISRSVEMIE